MRNIYDDCTLVFIPGFSGAPWDLERLKNLAHRPLRTMRLPESIEDIEKYVDYVEQKTVDLDRFIVVGDSFGALIAMRLALRQPSALVGMVLSGGFAVGAEIKEKLKKWIRSARLMPGPLYKSYTLRHHAESFSSPHDIDAEMPWTPKLTQRLFEKNTPHRSYVARLKAALAADSLESLYLVPVPTLVIAPSYDMLFGRGAAGAIVKALPNAEGIVLRHTGLMFRFTHPITYSKVVERFMVQHIDSPYSNTVVPIRRRHVHSGLFLPPLPVARVPALLSR